jgi:hypothetical protein
LSFAFAGKASRTASCSAVGLMGVFMLEWSGACGLVDSSLTQLPESQVWAISRASNAQKLANVWWL